MCLEMLRKPFWAAVTLFAFLISLSAFSQAAPTRDDPEKPFQRSPNQKPSLHYTIPGYTDKGFLELPIDQNSTSLNTMLQGRAFQSRSRVTSDAPESEANAQNSPFAQQNGFSSSRLQIPLDPNTLTLNRIRRLNTEYPISHGNGPRMALYAPKWETQMNMNGNPSGDKITNSINQHFTQSDQDQAFKRVDTPYPFGTQSSMGQPQTIMSLPGSESNFGINNYDNYIPHPGNRRQRVGTQVLPQGMNSEISARSAGWMSTLPDQYLDDLELEQFWSMARGAGTLISSG